MQPIPPDIGVIQCIVERNNKGLNKLWPKFVLKLLDGNVDIKFNTTMLVASKIKNSKTPHYRILLGNKPESKNGDNYIGRLRGNLANNEFYIFDTGLNYKEAIKSKLP